MDNTLYVGLSKQVTLQRAMDLTANNLANVDTVGFKVESLMVKTDPETPYNAPQTQPIKYVLDNGVARNFGQGPLSQTGGKLDVALEGDGFFAVTTKDGTRYTRDGRFAIDASNQLVDKAGNAVQGDGGSAISLDPQKGAPTIAADGTVSQRGSSVGKLGAVHFTDLSTLKKVGDNLYDSTETPGAARDTQLRQGMVEGSNVQPVAEVTSLIEITRTYERVAKMMSDTESLHAQAIDRLGKAA